MKLVYSLHELLTIYIYKKINASVRPTKWVGLLSRFTFRIKKLMYFFCFPLLFIIFSFIFIERQLFILYFWIYWNIVLLYVSDDKKKALNNHLPDTPWTYKVIDRPFCMKCFIPKEFDAPCNEEF